MKHVALLASAATLICSSARAEDLQLRKVDPVAPVTAAFTWTGFYAGVNAGINWSNRNVNSLLMGPDIDGNINVISDLSPAPYGANRVGAIGGVQLGYNYHINQIVIGAEADFIGVNSSNRSSATISTPGYIYYDNPTPALYTNTISTKVRQNWLGTIRARSGLAINRFLAYATGGLAFGGVKSDTSASISTTVADGLGDNLPPVLYSGSKASTQFGYAVGAGFEYALTVNWLIRAEYLYYNLGNIRNNAGVDGLPIDGGSFFTNKTTIDGNILRAAVSYKF